MSETPRTNTAAYNGHKYLRDECAALEIENRKLRDALNQIAAYDEPRKDGCCQYGCDCPHIAQTALANVEMSHSPKPSTVKQPDAAT